MRLPIAFRDNQQISLADSTLPLWLVLVELLELVGGVLILGCTGADGYSPSLSDVAPGTRRSRESLVDTDPVKSELRYPIIQAIRSQWESQDLPAF